VLLLAGSCGGVALLKGQSPSGRHRKLHVHLHSSPISPIYSLLCARNELHRTRFVARVLTCEGDLKVVQVCMSAYFSLSDALKYSTEAQHGTLHGMNVVYFQCSKSQSSKCTCNLSRCGLRPLYSSQLLDAGSHQAVQVARITIIDMSGLITAACMIVSHNALAATQQKNSINKI
jgi:hypothetical protein